MKTAAKRQILGNSEQLRAKECHMTGADEQTKDSQRQNMRPPFAKRAALARPFMGMRISKDRKSVV